MFYWTVREQQFVILNMMTILLGQNWQMETVVCLNFKNPQSNPDHKFAESWEASSLIVEPGQ